MLVAAFFLLTPIYTELLSSGIDYLDRRIESPGTIPIAIVSLILLFAWLAHWFGAPELPGVFAAGLGLSPRFFFPINLAIENNPVFSQKNRNSYETNSSTFYTDSSITVGSSLVLR